MAFMSSQFSLMRFSFTILRWQALSWTIYLTWWSCESSGEYFSIVLSYIYGKRFSLNVILFSFFGVSLGTQQFHLLEILDWRSPPTLRDRTNLWSKYWWKKQLFGAFNFFWMFFPSWMRRRLNLFKLVIKKFEILSIRWYSFTMSEQQCLRDSWLLCFWVGSLCKFLSLVSEKTVNSIAYLWCFSFFLINFFIVFFSVNFSISLISFLPILTTGSF